MTQTDLASPPFAVSGESGAPEVSLIIPVFNEEGTIEEVVRAAVAVLDGMSRPYEVIVVDDGSWTAPGRSSSGCTRPSRTCAPCASSATSGSTRRCTQVSSGLTATSS